MSSQSVIACLLICLAVPSFALAQDIAAERARLANQRIQAEEQRRSQEEEAQQQVPSQLRANQAGPDATAASPPPQDDSSGTERTAGATENETDSAPIDRIDMSRALEQLRELGALKDSGYLTDEEFRLLKQKILDGAL